MKTICLINQKGGVAKTATTYNLAAIKAQEGHSVLMVDLDPQCSLTISAGIEPGEDRLEGHSTTDLFDEAMDPADAVFSVTASGLDALYIVPGDISLAAAEIRLIEDRIIKKKRTEKRLKAALEKLSGYFEYVLVDCPPQLGQLTINALAAADEILIPCKTDYLSYRGLKSLLDTVQEIKKKINPPLKVLGIIGTFYEARVRDQQDILEMMKERAPVIGTIRKSADVSRKLVHGKPAVLAMPGAAVSDEYRLIAAQI